MLTTISKYPFFDLSEIIPENDLTYKTYQKLKPVKTGNLIPDINLVTDYKRWKNFYNGAPTHGPISLKHLYGKPLAIAFYSKHWRGRGIDQLKQLNALQNEIKANGGNLLILTDEAGDEQLAKITWDNSLSLNFYHDINNEIAAKFRVYSDEDPTWNSFSGIDVNIPLLAVYVIDTDRHIVYDHIDRNLTDLFIADDLVNAVYEASLVHTRKKSA
ncbi:redoxin domain-containing protein [Mucilaginibacter sp. UR6-11]|uniref:redoxin domain-containing protein n=1 Tax=Mucilaginibacter sp. UR6-11 TaxID=1435644 RepID=UPI001E4CE838|nr:redoxin domain-containing protein [Mucilaginibacter sp. UR6-11]MCC8426274.1 peroxiredoxin family protein [Mucilaginibacter sp. UR6-11]